jgi:LCP family protein required for cell wall assembly
MAYPEERALGASPRRRQLSRRIPWQLPTAFFLLLCLFAFAIARLGRGAPPEEQLVGVPPVSATNSPAADNPADDPAATAPTVPEATAEIVAAKTIESTPDLDLEATAEAMLLEGDPLDDPAAQGSALDEHDQINILLLGTDGRDEEDGPPRTDLLMLLLIDRNAPTATLISIPRDLWVTIPGYGEGKINTAYFLGSLDDEGPELARETIEGVFGLEIDRTVQVDFNGFRNLVSEMGGIEIDVPEAIDDPEFPDENYGTFHLVIPAGRQTMDGETALRYARTRYGGMDQDRSARQQAVVMAIREKALKPTTLVRAPALLRTIYRTVESNLTLGDLFFLARLGRSMDRDDIAMHTLNNDGEMIWSAITWNGQDALLYDEAMLRSTVRGWMRGEE